MLSFGIAKQRVVLMQTITRNKHASCTNDKTYTKHLYKLMMDIKVERVEESL